MDRRCCCPRIPGPDRHPGQPHRGAREIGVDHRQAVGDDGSTADRAKVGVVVGDTVTEVGPSLLDPEQVVAQPTQVVGAVGAVAEQLDEELDVGHTGDGVVDPIGRSVEGVDLLGSQKQVEQPGNCHDKEPAEHHSAAEQHQRNDSGIDEELRRSEVMLAGLHQVGDRGNRREHHLQAALNQGHKDQNTSSRVRTAALKRRTAPHRIGGTRR